MSDAAETEAPLVRMTALPGERRDQGVVGEQAARLAQALERAVGNPFNGVALACDGGHAPFEIAAGLARGGIAIERGDFAVACECA